MTYSCIISEHVKISGDIFSMTLNAAEIAEAARPGQFLQVRVSTSIDPLLRRPFSIHRINRKKGQIMLLYRVIGKGTAILAQKVVGEEVDVMGPLGNGFSIQKPFNHALIVAGGMGSAPVFFLMDELRSMGKNISFLWGAKTGCEIFSIDELKQTDINLLLATEDGTLGETGFVTDCLQRYLEDFNPSEVMGFVCGPAAMIYTVQKMALETSFEWQVSVEERMACGVGVCMGCAVPISTNDFKLVCKDGPVFDLKEIVCHG